MQVVVLPQLRTGGVGVGDFDEKNRGWGAAAEIFWHGHAMVS